MFKLLFNADLIYDLIALVVIGLIIIACFKSTWGKYVFFSVLSIIILATGIYSYFQIDNYNNSSGGIWGSIVGDFSVNNVETKDLSFDLKSLELTQASNLDENVYLANLQSDKTVSIENGKYYTCYVNGLPAVVDEFSSEYLIANYPYNFYDYDRNLIVSDTLKLRFSFYKNYTNFVVQTEGGSIAVKNWNNYFKNNNFIIELRFTDEPLEVQSYLEQFIKVDFVYKYHEVLYPGPSYFLRQSSSLSEVAIKIESQRRMLQVEDGFYHEVDVARFLVDDVQIDMNTYVFSENTLVVVECIRHRDDNFIA